VKLLYEQAVHLESALKKIASGTSQDAGCPAPQPATIKLMVAGFGLRAQVLEAAVEGYKKEVKGGSRKTKVKG
jgi:hypothetical protein